MARKIGWHITHTFEGKPDWEKLNVLIREQDGNPEPFFLCEEDYWQSKREGFVKYDGKVTTIWNDGVYEG